MDKVTGKLTVFFDDPFWAGVFERVEDGRLSVCKVVFGAEPSDADVYEIILKRYDRLAFSPAVDYVVKKTADNPKRRQREAAKATRASGVGTKSQQALQLQREGMKMARKQNSRARRLAEQQKRREKHRGH